MLIAVMSCFVVDVAQADNNTAKGWAIPVDSSFKLYEMTPFLYRSALPSSSNVDVLKERKINTIISFIKDDDRQWLADEQVNIIRYPTHADRVTDDDVLAVLRMIREAQSYGPVLIHCKHGQNRTGLFAAMYRIVVQGWSKQEALDELQNAGFGDNEDMQEAIAYINSSHVKRIKIAFNTSQCSTRKLAFCHLFAVI